MDVGFLAAIPPRRDPQQSSDRRLVGPQNQSGHSEEHKHARLCWEPKSVMHILNLIKLSFVLLNYYSVQKAMVDILISDFENILITPFSFNDSQKL
jgi:hypothetical protein